MSGVRLKDINLQQLYVSDLDGTLLNSNKVFSAYTKRVINKLAEEGIAFTVATARTQASTIKLLEGMNLEMPIILMNGVVIYDLKNGCYVNIEALSQSTAENVIGILRGHGIDGFMYTISDGTLCTYYERLESDAMHQFHDERVKRYYKTFEQTQDFLDLTPIRNTIYFACISERDRLLDAYNILKEHSELNVELYRDIYSRSLWYLEVFSIKASKCSAVEFLRREYGFGHIIGFGDNLNDIALFKACDEGYAVSNAISELKKVATGIIGANNSDSVTRFIAERERLWRV